MSAKIYHPGDIPAGLRLTDIYWVCWRELKKFFSQKTRILMTVIQPLIWLLFLGNSLTGLTSNPFASKMLGVDNYLVFMTPGIMVMTSLFGGIFGGMSVVWDRHFGYLNKMLAAPISRAAIPMGKMLAAAIQSVIQVTIITIIATFLGVRFACGPAGILLIAAIIFLFSFGVSGISISLGAVIRSHETLMAIVNFLTMPLMFASNAMFPVEAMPVWLQTIARWNPLSYAVAPLRELVGTGLWSASIGKGLLVMFIFAVLMSLVASRQFRRSIA
jgi:ABC-2 type transport system permease protein